MESQQEPKPAIEVTEVRKYYKDTRAVDGISLSISRGETLGILGPNGAGKTTLVEMIAGLRRPDHGRIRVLGFDPDKDRRPVRQMMGVQLQAAQLHNSLTVGELVALYRSFYPNPRSAGEALEMVQLTDKHSARFEKLSGGQMQRLSVTLALIGRPRVVILDELTTGLDPRARRRIWATVQDLRDDGVTVVLVSHAMDEVERLCDRIVLLADGRILTAGTATEITHTAQADSLEEAFVSLTGSDVPELEE